MHRGKRFVNGCAKHMLRKSRGMQRATVVQVAGMLAALQLLLRPRSLPIAAIHARTLQFRSQRPPDLDNCSTKHSRSQADPMAGLSADLSGDTSQPDEVLAPAQPAANGVADPPAAPPPPLGAAAVTSGAVGAAAQHVHALRAFSRRQAAAWAQWDVTSSLLLALLFALASSVARWRARGWATAGAGLAQLALLLTPGLLSAVSPRRWYLPRRHWVSAACRLLSLGLYERVTPLALLLPREWGGSWAATLKLLAFLRLPSLSMMAWAYRMPLPVSAHLKKPGVGIASELFKVGPTQGGTGGGDCVVAAEAPCRLFRVPLPCPCLGCPSPSPPLQLKQLLAAVHLLATLEAVRTSFSAICPLLCDGEGQAQLRRLAGVAQFLTMLSPIPSAGGSLKLPALASPVCCSCAGVLGLLPLCIVLRCRVHTAPLTLTAACPAQHPLSAHWQMVPLCLSAMA